MESKVLIINESTAKSIITDTYTVGCFVGCLFLNYHFLGNSAVLTLFICTMLILITAEAIKYLTDRQNEGET